MIELEDVTHSCLWRALSCSSRPVWPPFSRAHSLALGILVAHDMGPSSKRSQLTGRHRIVPMNRSMEMVKPG
jgi:hypothetical protein